MKGKHFLLQISKLRSFKPFSKKECYGSRVHVVWMLQKRLIWKRGQLWTSLLLIKIYFDILIVDFLFKESKILSSNMLVHGFYCNLSWLFKIFWGILSYEISLHAGIIIIIRQVQSYSTAFYNNNNNNDLSQIYHFSI